MSAIHLSLQKHFGYKTFRPGQEQAINTLLAGRSVAAIFPTGSGKSLIYQLAALHLPKLTLVVSPLLALISDQLESMQQSGIPAARIDSTLDNVEMRKIRDEVKQGRVKILMISVERFKNETFRQFLSGVELSLMVIDEAHCISEWGHNFRPDYLKLPEYKRNFNIPQVLLLTATATPKVIGDMCKRFAIAEDDVVMTGFYRPNLHLSVLPVAEEAKMEKLAELLKPVSNDSTIVYVTLQRTAEEVASNLRQEGINAVAYHAGMNNVERESIQSAFMYGQIPVIVATIAFGMGIDKSDIRQVIHYDLPKSIESYSQEIGRAGRDGKLSYCTLLGNKDKVNVLENFVYGDSPERSEIKELLGRLAAAGSRLEIQILSLSNAVNIRQLPLKTLLVYLEMEGLIKPLYSFYASYKYKNVLDDEQILAKFPGERRAFLRAILDNSTKARIWTTVDFDAVMANYNTDRQRIIAALDYFDSKGFIQLEASQMSEVFEVLQPGFDVEQLSDLIYEKFASREKSEVQRIKDMIDFFEGERCLSVALSEYFGETSTWENCGHCSVCLSSSAKFESSLSLEPLSKAVVDSELAVLKTEHGGRNLSPVTLTRFLCGIHTPLFTSIKASSISGYGAFENYRFEEVLKYC